MILLPWTIDRRFRIWSLDLFIFSILIFGIYASGARLKSSLNLQSLAPELQPAPGIFDSELKGIDASHYQGVIQWEVVEELFTFAFVKATEGESYIDPRLADNLRSLAKTDLAYGAYHFFLPSVEPLNQARHFLKSIEPYTPSLPPVLDVEVAPPGGDIASFQSSIQAWLDQVQQHTGCQPIIYTSRSFWNQYLEGRFNGYPLWVSDYTSEEGRLASIPWSFWQFTDKSRIDGVSGPVDQSRFRGDESSLKAMRGARHEYFGTSASQPAAALV